MALKIGISHFYDQNEPKQWKSNKIRHFSMGHTQTMELEQNQTFFRGTYSNLTLIFIGRKILKYFNDFYNWHFSISLLK